VGFVLSVSELSKYLQRRHVVDFSTTRIHVSYKFHLVKLVRIWYRLHTQLVTGAFVMPARTTMHAATHTKKRQPQHTTGSATGPWPMPPQSSPGDKLIKNCYKNSSTGARSTSHAPVTPTTSIESATSTSAHETVITFDVTSEVTQDPVISRTT
jgi:hypothetical protein